MRELTGFALAKISGTQAIATPTALGKQLGLTQPFGVPAAIAPLFAASDAKATGDAGDLPRWFGRHRTA